MTVAESFEKLVSLFNPTAAGSMNKTLQWNVTGTDAGKYAVKIANGTCELIQGGVEKADTTFTIGDTDWMGIVDGALDPMTAFTSGKLKVAGDIMLATKIQQLFPIKR